VVSVAFVVAVAGSAAITAEQQDAAHGAAARTVASHGLPASLDALYPPQAREPVFLMRMVDLGARMTGVAVDLATQDLEHLASSFAEFESTYRATSDLVPEWRDRFPMEPVNALGLALASGDPDRVGPAWPQWASSVKAATIRAWWR
jgi:hypothetical protein